MRSKLTDHLAEDNILLEASHQRVQHNIAARRAARRSITLSQFEEQGDPGFGQRAADAVARFGGSWTFIITFAVVLCCWVLLNSWLLGRNGHQGFDPYPYILPNLFLSMLASIQAPVILMSQIRLLSSLCATAGVPGLQK